MLEALRPLYVEGLGVRIVSEFGWIIGKVPAPDTHPGGRRYAYVMCLHAALRETAIASG
jgi:hypothetical protein